MPKFEKGKSRSKNAGRKKGTPNKVNKNIKENFEAVFEALGGWEGFYNWAKKRKQNQADFYKMYSKMLPSNVSMEHSGTIKAELSMKDLKDSLKDFDENGSDSK